MFGNFTDRARSILTLSQEVARKTNRKEIGSEHMLLAFIGEGDGIAIQALTNKGLIYEELVRRLDVVAPPLTHRPLPAQIPFSADARKVLDLANEEAIKGRSSYIGDEHLLLGILRNEKSLANRLLRELGLDLLAVREEVLRLSIEWEHFLQSQNNFSNTPEYDIESIPPRLDYEADTKVPVLPHSSSKPIKTPALDAYAHNLTQDAIDGKLDPVIGRDKEVERLMQVLGRRSKNNPVLVGDPGVGKTSVVEGLAQRIARNDVPSTLRGQQIFTLDLSGMVAGTRFRGDFEERLKKTIKEVHSRGDVILFLDEIHTLVGAGGHAEGTMDASSILKPLLARGELRLIGATTLDEYRKYIEKDAALERRFQPVRVEATSVADTIEILKGLRGKYETHHRVTITDEAIVAAAILSDRYISDRNLPDKAIDLLDESGARLQIQKLSRSPQAILLDKEIAKVRTDKEAAIEAQTFELAASLRTQEISLIGQRDSLANGKTKVESIPLVVTAEVIAEMVTMVTGIPVNQMTSTDLEHLANIENELHRRVIGQKQAISALSRAIRRSRAGLKDPNRPAGSFIFAGPSGVGKSELTKALAEFLHGNEDALITIDMSEYAEKHSASRLFGSPPGYVGHEEGGQLTEKVRRKPFSVILFDEIEKAHPDIANTLLQVLDEGRLTDAQGRSIDFKNTIIVMTTNLGSRDVAKSAYLGFSGSATIDDYDRMKGKVQDELKQYFRPEFLNRLDEIIVFQTLTMDEIVQIVDLIVGELNVRLHSRSILLELTTEAKVALANLGYDKALGARPLRRVIQREIEDPISERVLTGSLSSGQTMKVDLAPESVSTFTFDIVDTETGLDDSDSSLANSPLVAG
jgi:ATP-dependent Clp protease ATP-binding subunit ClpC